MTNPERLLALEALRDVNGVAPFNHYLWPTESWWLNDAPGFENAAGRWHFGIVALADGRFATEGSTYRIIPAPDDDDPPVVFADRTTAIRTGAARLIRVMRGSRNWGWQHDRLAGARLAGAVNWVLATVARETAAGPARVITISDPPTPPVKTGLELFDFQPPLATA